MTWMKCRFCDHRENGYRRMKRHEEEYHTREHKRNEALADLNRYIENAARDAQYIADHEDYRAALLMVLPPLARKLIEDRLRQWPYDTKSDGEMGIDRLRWAVEYYHPQQIALRQKALQDAELALSEDGYMLRENKA